MTSIWFPNNKYPPNTKNYLPCFVLGGGVLVLGGRDYNNYNVGNRSMMEYVGYIYIYMGYIWVSYRYR